MDQDLYTNGKKWNNQQRDEWYNKYKKWYVHGLEMNMGEEIYF